MSGGYLYDRKLVEYLRGRGDEVELITLPWRNYVRHLGDNFSRPLRKKLEELRVDVLLQDELNHPSLAWVNRQIRGQIDYPLVGIVHHLRSSEDHPGWLAFFYRQVERAYLNSLDGFIFNSQTTRQSVERLIGRGVSGLVAYPAGDRFPISMSAEEIAARAVRPGPLEVLSIGNLIPRKNLHLVLKALALVEKNLWRLTIVGSPAVDPAYSRRLRKLAGELRIQERVNFLGSLSDADLACQLRQNQLLAAPSAYEGFGIVYLEGFQHGLPALGSTRGAAAEIITPGETGWLVEPDAVVEAADWLDRTARDRLALTRMSRAAFARFQDFPTWAQTGEMIRNFLNRFILG
jgi:glycosyltransferase involved in cell wall biosynthesis